MSYGLGVDLGTSFVAAAIGLRDDLIDCMKAIAEDDQDGRRDANGYKKRVVDVAQRKIWNHGNSTQMVSELFDK